MTHDTVWNVPLITPDSGRHVGVVVLCVLAFVLLFGLLFGIVTVIVASYWERRRGGGTPWRPGTRSAWICLIGTLLSGIMACSFGVMIGLQVAK